MKKAEEKSPFLYDPTVPQYFPFIATINGKDFHVAHKVAPITDEKFFQYSKADVEWRKKYSGEKASSVKLEREKHVLWNDLALERFGWKPRDDWKDITADEYKEIVIDELLGVVPTKSDGEEILDESLIDDDENFEIEFRCAYGGIDLETWRELVEKDALPEWIGADGRSKIISRVKINKFPALKITLSHWFRALTQDEKDEITTVLEGKPAANALAKFSHGNPTPAERLCAVWEAAKTGVDGYADKVPAHHKAATILIHYVRERTRAKKS
jgi:hypothetical protein